MRIAICLMISVSNGFLHPLLNLGPPRGIAGRMGFPALTSNEKPYRAIKRRPSKSRSFGGKNNWVELSGNRNKAMCSFPCQRVSHFVKVTDIVQKWGLAHELRNVFKFMCGLYIRETPTICKKLRKSRFSILDDYLSPQVHRTNRFIGIGRIAFKL